MHCHHIKFKLPLNTCILKYAYTVNVCAANSTTYWDMTPCNLIEIYRLLSGICCPHLQNTVSNPRRVCFSHWCEPWVPYTGQCFVESDWRFSQWCLTRSWHHVFRYMCVPVFQRNLLPPSWCSTWRQKVSAEHWYTSSKLQCHFNIVIKWVIHIPCNLAQRVSIFKNEQ
jgi:hypothetical protein